MKESLQEIEYVQDLTLYKKEIEKYVSPKMIILSVDTLLGSAEFPEAQSYIVSDLVLNEKQYVDVLFHSGLRDHKILDEIIFQNYNLVNRIKRIPRNFPLIADFSSRTRALSRWNPGDTIIYKIDTESFSIPQAELLDSLIEEAFQSWCWKVNLFFEKHKAGSDYNLLIQYRKSKNVYNKICGKQDAIFVLTPLGKPLNVNKQPMLIYEQFFSAHEFNKVGILRHEIGHVLGFLHTCALSQKFLPNEIQHCDSDITPITIPGFDEYDSTSVMKSLEEACSYKDYAFEISELDERQASIIYKY